MDIPTHLSHKPIVKLDEYSKIDGRFKNKTDAQGLSIGLAQWNDHNNPDDIDLSAKIWRHTGGKWSRQSEELPLHRALDLASLVCAAICYVKNDTVPMYDDFNISLAKNNKFIAQLKDGMEKENGEAKYLDKSLSRLSKYLKQIGY